jgi:hypothetical protein
MSYQPNTGTNMLEYNKLIKTFARDILSCGCDDEVFNHIGHQSRIPVTPDIEAYKRINIGNRLLVYIIKVEDPESIKGNLVKILSAGKKDRDTTGFNRFRLALIAPEGAINKKILSEIFDEFRNGDEKIHLHILDQDNEIIKKLMLY